jgi:hypothetical protein
MMPDNIVSAYDVMKTAIIGIAPDCTPVKASLKSLHRKRQKERKRAMPGSNRRHPDANDQTIEV